MTLEQLEEIRQWLIGAKTEQLLDEIETITTTYCLVLDGDTRWYTCPSIHREEAKAYFQRVEDYQAQYVGYPGPEPTVPPWLIYIENLQDLVFANPVGA